MKKRR